jgi:hypothetical protein
MSTSRPLLSLLAVLAAAAAFAGSAQAQTAVPFGSTGSTAVPMPYGTTPLDAQGGAPQGGHKGGHHAGLRTLDTNGDHMLSRAEVASHHKLAKNFDAIDTNHDGQLSHEELRAWRATHRGLKSGGTTN